MRTHAMSKTKASGAAVEFFSRKLEFEIGPYMLKQILDLTPAKVYIVDVRGADAYAAGHLPGAVAIPLADLAGHLKTLPKDRTIVTYCGDLTCPLSSKAALELAQKGFTVQHLVGGIAEWTKKGYHVDSAQPAKEEKPEERGEKEEKEDGGQAA